MKQLRNLLASIKRLFRKTDATDINQDRFNAICDLLYYSIKKDDDKLAKKIDDFMLDEFDRVRRQFPDSEVKFGIQYYELTKKLTQLLVNTSSKIFDFLKDRSVGGTWLLGEREGYQISGATYSYLWANLKIAVEYKDQNMIMAFWKNAHQYISSQLYYIHEEYDITAFPSRIINQTEVNERIKQRERFLQFSVTLGGLLIYSQLYATIQRCFRYTQSTPPKYDLLPESMDEVF